MLESVYSYIYVVTSYITDIYDETLQTMDSYYLWWVLAPLFFTMIVPMLILILFYVTILIFLLYSLHGGRIRNEAGINLRQGAIYLVAALWDVHSRLWHGYEVVGMEKIPADGPALLVAYHGAVPVDHYYLVSKIYIEKNRLTSSIADRFLFKLPGFKTTAAALNIIVGSVQECVEDLKKGSLLLIFPGGVYEAQFSDANYTLMWGKRLGFARVALEAKVPVIPIFTQNIRQAFVALSFGRPFWLKLYSWFKLPLVPTIGDFPVKLSTFIGDPIPYEPISPEELKAKVAAAVNELILKHQRLPGSVSQALLDRFRLSPQDKRSS